jgi:TorA maturation chaperone TorD
LALQADPIAKRRFDLSKISLETLAGYNFDVSQRMGSMLAQREDLSDVYSVKAVYQALFPGNQALSSAIGDPNLRLLSVRRNLIVHQRAVIDEEYLASTNCPQRAGERLMIRPSDLEDHIGTTVKTAARILEAVSDAQ